jgi:hypothetical protein
MNAICVHELNHQYTYLVCSLAVDLLDVLLQVSHTSFTAVALDEGLNGRVLQSQLRRLNASLTLSDRNLIACWMKKL